MPPMRVSLAEVQNPVADLNLAPQLDIGSLNSRIRKTARLQIPVNPGGDFPISNSGSSVNPASSDHSEIQSHDGILETGAVPDPTNMFNSVDEIFLPVPMYSDTNTTSQLQPGNYC